MSNTLYVGRTAEGYAVYAHIRAEKSDGHAVTMTDHTTGTVDVVSIRWTVADIRGTAANYAENDGAAMSSPFFDRQTIESGQVAPADRVVTVPAIDADTLRFIEHMWSAWHLNNMRAACDHMRPGVDYAEPDPAEYPTRYGRPDMTAWRLANVECSAGTGYRYGRAWLAERVPAAEWDRFAALAN